MFGVGNYFNGFSSSDYQRDLEKAIANSTQQDESTDSLSVPSENSEEFYEWEMKKAVQESLLDQENDVAEHQNKKQKSPQSLPVSVVNSAQDVVTPSVAANRSLKRKVREEISDQPEDVPTNRVDATFKALFGSLNKNCTD